MTAVSVAIERETADALRWRAVAERGWSLLHFPRQGVYLVYDAGGVELGRGASAEVALDGAIARAESAA